MPEPQAAIPSRRYRGLSAEARRAARRAALVDAAIALYGERGFASTSIEAVAAEAGLIKRYFYESFESAEALLVAAFESITAALFAHIDAAAADAPDPLPATLTAFFSALQTHPQFARVFFVEMAGAGTAAEAALEASRLALATRLVPGGDAGSLAAAGATGAVRQIALSWIAGAYAEPVDTVVAAAAAACTPLARQGAAGNRRRALAL
jgi:AcrR family transcriptional regulator